MTRVLTPPARYSAGLVALAGLAALATQAVVSFGLTGSLGGAIWALTGYFTVLTNLLVAVTFIAIAVRGAAPSSAWLAGLTLWIIIVAIVYHLLLARLWAPAGLAWWADQGLHSAVPVLVTLWWLQFAPKPGLRVGHAALWLAWPLLYTAYALVRGTLTGRYPYPFLDVTTIGYDGVALNGIGLTVAFFLGGLAMVGSAKALTR
ncbi:Pr6Pr family membrane protein [Maritimibacter sp. HL-12]|uniref:Pr6Pr family membrane protein n=1 Tax=Maritimibacter sp. HL-12 TaxID=1162418 RepID=UPI000A1CA37C|nr:Pr6Pr family membrane protein [Maritimibacter sp. HL-12]